MRTTTTTTAFLLGMMLSMTAAFGSPICLTNTTIQTSTNLSIGNTSFTPIVAETECPFGCDTENNRCNPSPFDTLIYYVIGGIIGVILLIIIILRLMK